MKEAICEKTEAEEQKKKPGQIDLQYLKSAEALVCAAAGGGVKQYGGDNEKEYLESRIRKEIREYKSNE